MSSVEIGAVIVALIQAIKTQFPKFNGIWTIATAAALGILAGIAGIAGLDWQSGLYVGLGAVGVITAVSKVGVAK
jgi:hypothetical protein